MESPVSLSAIEHSSVLMFQPKVETDRIAPKNDSVTLTAATSQARDEKKTKETGETGSLFDQLKQSINEIEDVRLGNNNSLRFKIDSTTGKITILVLNPEKNQVIRQIPQDFSERLPKNYSELAGMVVDIKI
jgi:uncharacterized FlaG/YvyC family protein